MAARAGRLLVAPFCRHAYSKECADPTQDDLDKVVHFTAFAILATLLATTWQVTAGHLTGRHLAVVWFVLVLYAAFDEWTQTLVGRECSIWDWTADALGAVRSRALRATAFDVHDAVKEPGLTAYSKSRAGSPCLNSSASAHGTLPI